MFQAVTGQEPFDRHLGVEIELENFLYDGDDEELISHWWTAKGDGSLRGDGAVEICFTSPLSASSATRAINALREIVHVLDDARATRRTGTHVHVSIRGLDKEAMKSFLVACAMLEPVLFALVDPGRERSVFCRPMWSCGLPTYRQIGAFIYGDADLHEVVGASNKYCGINLYSIMEHSSIEFRMAPGIRDPDVLLKWVDVIKSIYLFSNQVKLNDLSDSLFSMAEMCREVVESAFGWVLHDTNAPFNITSGEYTLIRQRMAYAAKNISAGV